MRRILYHIIDGSLILVLAALVAVGMISISEWLIAYDVIESPFAIASRYLIR